MCAPPAPGRARCPRATREPRPELQRPRPRRHTAEVPLFETHRVVPQQVDGRNHVKVLRCHATKNLTSGAVWSHSALDKTGVRHRFLSSGKRAESVTIFPP